MLKVALLASPLTMLLLLVKVPKVVLRQRLPIGINANASAENAMALGQALKLVYIMALHWVHILKRLLQVVQLGTMLILVVLTNMRA